MFRNVNSGTFFAGNFASRHRTRKLVFGLFTLQSLWGKDGDLGQIISAMNQHELFTSFVFTIYLYLTLSSHQSCLPALETFGLIYVWGKNTFVSHRWYHEFWWIRIIWNSCCWRLDLGRVNFLIQFRRFSPLWIGLNGFFEARYTFIVKCIENQTDGLKYTSQLTLSKLILLKILLIETAFWEY